MNYTNEHEFLINRAKERHLTADQIFFLLAVREVEQGVPGDEFNLKIATNTSLAQQSNWMMDIIVSESKKYLEYILSSGTGQPMSFPAYFAGQNLMCKEDMFMAINWVAKVEELMKEIERSY